MSDSRQANICQPQYYDEFRCLADACPDTCCEGWRVPIDKATYSRYLACSDAVFGPKLNRLITINVQNQTDTHFAAFNTSSARCGFLAEGLCSIHSGLGEDYLSQACASFPRIVNLVDNVQERSLDLACPEAAQLAFANPDPLRFTSLHRRSALIEILQDRRDTLAERLLRLAETCSSKKPHHSFNATFQLETVLELIVARISGDYTSPRFFEIYQRFAEGIEWTASSRGEELGHRYSEANRSFFEPFFRRHEYLLEHYLVHSLFKARATWTAREYMLLAGHYAMIRTLLIGLAGFYRAAFDVGIATKTIQICVKTLEHSAVFSERMLEILAVNGLKCPVDMAVLLMG